MKKILKISILLFILILSLSLVSATENNSDTNHNKLTKNSNDNYYTVSPNGKGVGKTDGNLFETIDHIEEEDTKATVNLKSGTYKFNNQTINGTYQSNRRLGKNNLKNISFIGNNTIFKADNVRFFNIQEGTTAEFINIIFTGGVATSGGSIYSEGNLILKNCSFTNSTSQRYGGTLYLRGDNNIENTDFTETHTTDSRGSGGVIYTVNSTLKMNNIKVNHAVANKTAGLLAAINSNIELKHMNVNNTYFVDSRGDSEIIFTNNSKIMINNSIFGNKSYEDGDFGGLFGFYNTDSFMSSVEFQNINNLKGRSIFGLIYNEKNSIINNVKINNVTQYYNDYPLIYNLGTINITNLSYFNDDKNIIILQNNKTAYLTGSLNNLTINNIENLYLNNIYNSSITSQNGNNYLSNIEFSTLNISYGGLNIKNIFSCLEYIDVWGCVADNVTSTNPLSSWKIYSGDINNCYFNNIAPKLYLINVTNTTFANLSRSLNPEEEANFDNVSFINSSIACLSIQGNTSIKNSKFKNNKCDYPILFDERYPNNKEIRINNTVFMNNNGKSSIKSFYNNEIIIIENSSFINNTYSLHEAIWTNNKSNARLKNNIYSGNNLSTSMIGNLKNSILIKTSLKGTLHVVPNEIYNTMINTGKASIYVDHKLYGNYGVFDGYIYVTVNNLSKGNHVINVKYSDNTNSFRPSEKLFNVLVDDRILTKVISGDKYAYAGSKITFNASVFDNKNKPITTGRMVIKINGITESSITLKNTNKITFNYTVPNYTAKNYKLQYIYVGDNKIARYEANNTLHILNQSARITTNDVICYHDQIAQVNVRLVGEKTGIPVDDGEIGLQFLDTTHINDFPIILQKVKNGRATFNYKIPKSMKAYKYLIFLVYFGGRNIQESVTGHNTLTVKDHTTIIDIETKKLTQSKTNLVFVEVKDSNGNIESGRATMKIGSDTVSETSINNGQAIFSYYVPTYYLGTYNMTITAKGTYTDQNSSKTTITVVK